MNKEEEWYKDKILWKTNKQNLFHYKCIKFDDLEDEYKLCIKKIIPSKENPILVFFDSCNKWTVLSTQSVCSYHEKILYLVLKNNLIQKITPYAEKGKNLDMSKFKKEPVHWLKMNETGEYIWLPSSKELWGFWPILVMLGKLKYNPNLYL